MSARRWNLRVPTSLVVTAVVLCLVVISVVTAKPWKAGDAGDQIHSAQADPIWKQVPTDSTETYRYKTSADADWIPWGRHVTAVGRYYTSPDARADAVLSWQNAARRTGWTPACLVTQPHAAKGNLYTKQLGASTGVLEIREDPGLTTEVGITISFGKQAGPEFCAGQS